MPTEVFTSSVRSLKLETNYQCPEFQCLPSVLSESRLTRLELVNVVLPVGNSKGELVLSCPMLGDLILKKCRQAHLKVLNLSAKQLKKLEIHNVNGERGGLGDYLVDCRLELHTPKLLYFVYKGTSYVEYSFGHELAELMSVKVSFCTCFTCSENSEATSFKQQSLREASYAANLGISP